MTYAASSNAGTLTVSQAQANVMLANLTQNFNGTGRSVSVTTNPPGWPIPSRTQMQMAIPSRAPRPRASTA